MSNLKIEGGNSHLIRVAGRECFGLIKQMIALFLGIVVKSQTA